MGLSRIRGVSLAPRRAETAPSGPPVRINTSKPKFRNENTEVLNLQPNTL